MASQYPAAFLDPTAEYIAEATLSELQQPITVSELTPKVAGLDPFIQAAQQRAAQAAGLGTIQRGATGDITGFTGGTGIAAFEPFLQQIGQQGLLTPTGYQAFQSPYQQEVIQTTQKLLEEEKAKGLAALAPQAIGAGAFGGAREGVAQAEYLRGRDISDAAVIAQLREQGLQQARQQQQQALQNLTSMASLVPTLEQAQVQQLGTLGAGQQAYQQSILDAQRQAAQIGADIGLQRLQTAGDIFGRVAGATPGAIQAPVLPSPAIAGIQGLAGAFGLLSAPQQGQQPTTTGVTRGIYG